MNNTALTRFLDETFGADACSEAFGLPALTVDGAAWQQSAATIRSAMSTDGSMLVCLSAIDRAEEGFELFAHLRDVTDRSDVVMRTLLGKQELLPSVDSLCSLWEAAELMEDEVFDLFGIRFAGHPNLRRIMLDDEFEGYPLRKDFKQTTHND